MDAHANSSRRFSLDDLVVDTGTQQVWRGTQLLDVPELSFSLLLALAEAAPNLLTHDELMERVWSGRIVSQETITQRVKLLRSALGDDASEPRYIGLVRGRGYRLLVDVRPAHDRPGTMPSPLPWRRAGPWFGAAVLLVALAWWVLDRREDAPDPTTAAPATVAVLPFVNATGDPDDQFISEGLGDELRNQLGRQADLRVAARSSSNAFRDRALSAPEISERLGVALLIEGALRREANDLWISIQIVDGPTGYQDWSRTYQVQVQDLLAVQSQIAWEVTEQLLPRADSLAPQPVTRSVSANELLLLARHYEQQVRDEPIVNQPLLLEAISLYREATRADPASALAHSHLGAALLYLGDVASAEAPIFEALRLDSELADVQYTLGLYHWMRREPGAGAAYERAIALNPNHVEALSALAKWWAHQFQPNRGEPFLRRALRLDPMTPHRYLELGNYLGIAGDTEAAKALVPEIEQRFGDARGYAIIARIHELAGELDVAIGWILRAKRAEPGNAELDWSLAELLARLEMFKEAARFEPEPGIGQLFWQRRWPELVSLAEERSVEYPAEEEIRYALGWAYTVTGRFDEAVRVLEFSGLPQNALVESRRSTALEAGVTLIDAYAGQGNRESADALATWYTEVMSTMDANSTDHPWWPNVYLACAHAILGEDDRALRALERVAASRGLVWSPLVTDARCFQRLRGQPRFDRVLVTLDDRIANLRERLPVTLRGMGVDMAEAGRSERPGEAQRERVLDDVHLVRVHHGQAGQ